MAEQTSHKVIGATVYASTPHRDCAIAFSGEEDFRLFLSMPKAAADKLADQLHEAGFGKAGKYGA